MPKGRKTISVNSLIDTVNNMLASGGYSREQRQAQMVVLEKVLFDTGNYRGYRLLSKREVPVAELPGINIDQFGEPDPDYKALFHLTDDTRVQYHKGTV